MHLRKPSGTEGSPPPPHHTFGEKAQRQVECHRAKGEGHGDSCIQAVWEGQTHPESSPATAQGWGQDSLLAPAFPTAPQVLPCPRLRAPGMELSAIPEGKEVWDLLISLNTNTVFLPLDKSVLCSGQSSGPENCEITAAAPAERETAHSLVCHPVPLDLGTPLS